MPRILVLVVLGGLIALTFVLFAALRGEHGPFEVTCTTTSIPKLHEFLPFYRSARVCYPASNGSFPLHVFAHGNDAGAFVYDLAFQPLQEQIASFGFVVLAYLSCWDDSECNNGEASFIEILKVIEFFEQNPYSAPVDLSKPYSASGVSTGARAVLMLAALRDDPAYLANTSLAAQVSPSMRVSLSKMKAVIADHPDPMNDPEQNPDIPHFNIKRTAVFIITGSGDQLEPKYSAWKDFVMLSTPDKMFINVAGAGHLESSFAHREGPFIAYFAQYFALGDIAAGSKIYSDSVGSLRRVLRFAKVGERNDGNGIVSFVACSQGKPAVPEQYARYCKSAEPRNRVFPEIATFRNFSGDRVQRATAKNYIATSEASIILF